MNGRGQPKSAERLEEDLLREILGVRRVAYPAKDEVVDADYIVAVHGFPILIGLRVDHP